MAERRVGPAAAASGAAAGPSPSLGGMASPPFAFALSPDQAVAHPAWREARERVLAALRAGRKLVLVLGPPGTGKTLLLREIARTLRAEDGADAVLQLRGDLSIEVGPRVDEAARRCRRWVVLIDEAPHRADRRGLDRLGSLGECAFVLARTTAATGDEDGQRPPGEGGGGDPLVAAAAAAVVVRLTALPPGEVGAFVAARLTQAGLPADLLSGEAVARLAECSGGVPHLVNVIAGAALRLARAERARHVEAGHVDWATMLPPWMAEVAPATSLGGAPPGADAAPLSPEPLASKRTAPRRGAAALALCAGVAVAACGGAASLVLWRDGPSHGGDRRAAPPRLLSLAVMAAAVPVPSEAPLPTPTPEPEPPPITVVAATAAVVPPPAAVAWAEESPPLSAPEPPVQLATASAALVVPPLPAVAWAGAASARDDAPEQPVRLVPPALVMPVSAPPIAASSAVVASPAPEPTEVAAARPPPPAVAPGASAPSLVQSAGAPALQPIARADVAAGLDIPATEVPPSPPAEVAALAEPAPQAVEAPAPDRAVLVSEPAAAEVPIAVRHVTERRLTGFDDATASMHAVLVPGSAPPPPVTLSPPPLASAEAVAPAVAQASPPVAVSPPAAASSFEQAAGLDRSSLGSGSVRPAAPVASDRAGAAPPGSPPPSVPIADGRPVPPAPAPLGSASPGAGRTHALLRGGGAIRLKDSTEQRRSGWSPAGPDTPNLRPLTEPRPAAAGYIGVYATDPDGVRRFRPAP